MPIIKLNNKSFLREHPFLNPFSVPFPVQAHSFIFPGDEIVMYHKITLPTDVSASSMNDIKFVSAKASIIAQKPNVFSEEFSREFLSTRIFELDSFITSFNNLNARIIPWGVAGADGYAPNLTVKQDRSFLLPSGDFRREINFFTKHVDGILTWDYWFYFPILFRWEYWTSLLNADNDFYNAAQPQDGFNNWWHHYFVSGVWKIKSRLDVSVLINGVPQLIRCERDLTPNASDDVNDYSSNTDYTQKKIETSKVGGALSNTPCFVYGNEYTVVVGSLRKVTAWDAGEQANISAVSWIEPFEGAGVTARTRGSSVYTITPESSFIGIGLSATDDDGIGITDASGQYVVFQAGGKGAMVLFDSGVPEQIKIVSILDNNKLQSVYPGATKFTLYNRLYNSTEFTIDVEPAFLTSRKGEEIKQDATLVITKPSDIICTQKMPECPFVLNVYADATDSDELKNDKSDFYKFGDATIASLVLTLQKNDNDCGDGGWADVVTISDNSLGKFFLFGTNPDFSGVAFIDDYGKKYTGVFIEWRKVMAAHGIGKYRMKTTSTDVFGAIATSYDQREFCLSKYDCRRVDRSVKIETFNEGLRGAFGQNDLTDYAGGWRSEIRLKGLLKFKSSAYVKEFNQYGDSYMNAYKPIINEQLPKFTLSIRPVPGWMDFILSTNVLQADEIKITDYNLKNRHTLVKVPVMNDGDMAPRDNNFGNPLSDIDIDLAFGQNNLRKRNSQ